MEVKAVQKFIITSPKKLREVVPLIRNLSPHEAFEKLPFVKKRAAVLLRKVIGTAIANAKQANLNEGDLVFSEIQINEGPRLKRWRAGARGRAKPYKKRMSHIRVVLKTKEESITSIKSTTGIKRRNNKKPKTKKEQKSLIGKLGKKARKKSNMKIKIKSKKKGVAQKKSV